MKEGGELGVREGGQVGEVMKEREGIRSEGGWTGG